MGANHFLECCFLGLLMFVVCICNQFVHIIHADMLTYARFLATNVLCGAIFLFMNGIYRTIALKLILKSYGVCLALHSWYHS